MVIFDNFLDQWDFRHTQLRLIDPNIDDISPQHIGQISIYFLEIELLFSIENNQNWFQSHATIVLKLRATRRKCQRTKFERIKNGERITNSQENWWKTHSCSHDFRLISTFRFIFLLLFLIVESVWIRFEPSFYSRNGGQTSYFMCNHIRSFLHFSFVCSLACFVRHFHQCFCCLLWTLLVCVFGELPHTVVPFEFSISDIDNYTRSSQFKFNATRRQQNNHLHIYASYQSYSNCIISFFFLLLLLYSKRVSRARELYVVAWPIWMASTKRVRKLAATHQHHPSKCGIKYISLYRYIICTYIKINTE